MRNISFFFCIFSCWGIFVSNESINWQNATSSSISGLRGDDDEAGEELFSNREVTLQIVFCRKSGSDFPFDFIRCPVKAFFLI